MDDMIPVFDIIPVASRYHDIHPYSAMNIDSVEINVFQKMKTIKDWNVSFRQHLHILHDEIMKQGRCLLNSICPLPTLSSHFLTMCAQYSQ